MITHAFTCSGPYAVLIMLGIKWVENRGSRPVEEKGRYAVSCSKSFCAAEYGNFLQWASQCLPAEDFERVPAWADVKEWPGRIVGTCEVCVRSRAEMGAERGADGVRAPTVGERVGRCRDSGGCPRLPFRSRPAFPGGRSFRSLFYYVGAALPGKLSGSLVQSSGNWQQPTVAIVVTVGVGAAIFLALWRVRADNYAK